MADPNPVQSSEVLRLQQLARARRQLRQQSELSLARLRLAGAVAFLLLAAWLGYGEGLRDWRLLVPILGAYAALAAGLLLVARGEGPLRTLGVAAPSLDVLVVYLLQHLGMPLSPHPAGVAGWTLGPMVLLVLLASLTLRPRMIVVTAAVAMLCEAALQREAGIHWGGIAASAIILGLTAAVTAFATRRLENLSSRMVEEEVAARLEHERNVELERATAEVRSAHRELARQHTELIRAQQRAAGLSELMVHDLKGPLTSVLTLLELMAESQAPTDPAHADLAVALREGRRMLAMVQDLLAISRLEEGALRISAREQRVLPIFEAVAAAHGPSARQRGVPLTLRVSEELRGFFDPPLVHRVVENLVLNALRFVGRGQGIELSAEASAGGVRLVVANNGAPISPQGRRTLFDKQTFAATSESGRHNYGLGLTFCRLVAEAHGGRIALEDVPGWTVAFVVSLPGEPAVQATPRPSPPDQRA